MNEEIPSVAQFFAGRCIFITGSTGFMGKALLEKLLRSCPDVEKIYLLLRPKKGHNVDERLAELKKNMVFERLREERPDALDTQLVAIAGDVSEPGLGLSAADRQVLCDKISIVFHSAATVRFDDPIRQAVNLNTGGTYQMIKLAQDMNKLLVFLYVSTTYCNTNRFEIDEAVYPAGINWRSMLRMLEEFDDETLNIVTPKLLRKLPNTYSFSKGLSEDCIYEHRDSVPAVIYRPSVVCSSMSEPVPGWMDNFNGPAGLLIACGKGLVHSTLCNTNKIMDFSPVDVAIKGMIVAVWKNGVERMGLRFALEPAVTEAAKDDGRRPDVVPVYNCATSSIRPVTIGFVTNMAYALAAEVALNDVLWYPSAITTTNRFLHNFLVLFMQLLPAAVIDLALRFRGQKPRLLKIQRRIFLACEALTFYLNNEWTFPNNRFVSLQNYTSEEDKKLFGSQVWEENEYEYFRDCMVGARKYLLMEPEDTLPAAKRHLVRMYYVDKVVRGVLLALVGYLLCSYFGLLGSKSAALQAVQSPV